MEFDFELKNGKGRLKLGGSLGDADFSELQRVLALSMETSKRLELDIDDVTTFSSPCIKVLDQIRRLAAKKERALTLATHYDRESMARWLEMASKNTFDDNREGGRKIQGG